MLEMRGLHGRFAWDGVLSELHVSRRTATNYVALYLFSVTHPALYERFRVLGPTKLYRLARVAPERLRDMTLDSQVPTKDGEVRLGSATDRQLESALKVMFPTKRRTRVERIQEASRRIAALTSSWPADEAPTAETLDTAAVAIREAGASLSLMATALRNRGDHQVSAPAERPAGGAEDVAM